MNESMTLPLRELVALHVPVVVGSAFKLAMVGYTGFSLATKAEDEALRLRSGMSRHLWELHSKRVCELARAMHPMWGEASK